MGKLKIVKATGKDEVSGKWLTLFRSESCAIWPLRGV